jgi:nucleoside 2-deoxyribosyltransferase
VRADRLVVYLAGPVRGPNALWRNDFEHLLNAVPHHYPTLIFPGANVAGATDDAHANMRTDLYVAGDLLSVRDADLVVALLLKEESGRGTSFELGYAHALGKPILPVAATEEDRTSWCFAIGATPHFYPHLGAVAEVVRYLAEQASGTARFDPGAPGA